MKDIGYGIWKKMMGNAFKRGGKTFSCGTLRFKEEDGNGGQRGSLLNFVPLLSLFFSSSESLRILLKLHVSLSPHHPREKT
jgi:hypothetical protein